uniref:Uncharacterized protein n=1 Tax=Tanacetum cinerariifolium TaxID=118510 RepID=A0A6L2MD21_TANCI|nr:hypothetical protein [Tanacetum cinerariifolium]
MTPATSSSGLVPIPIPQQPCNPPPRDDWDCLFQPMFDEYFNPPTIDVSTVPVVVAPRVVDLADSPVSTSIDQDAPSTSIPSTQDQKHSLIISQAYADADHAECQDTRRSTSGSAQFLGDKLDRISTGWHLYKTLAKRKIQFLDRKARYEKHVSGNTKTSDGGRGRLKVVTHVFRDILSVFSRVSGQEFDEPPTEEEALSFIRELGHSRERSRMYYKKNLDFVTLIWEDLAYQIDNKDNKKQDKMFYPRFTKIIIHHFLEKDKSISLRNRMFIHTTRDDSLLGTMRFVSRDKDAQKPKTKFDLAISSEETPSKKKPTKAKKDVPSKKKPASKPKPTMKAPIKADTGDSGEEDDDDDEDDTEDDEGNDDGDDSDGNDDDDNDGDDDDDNDHNDDDYKKEQEEHVDEFTDEDDEDNKEEFNDGEELYKDVNVNLRQEGVEMTDAGQGATDQHNVSQEFGFEQEEEKTLMKSSNEAESQKDPRSKEGRSSSSFKDTSHSHHKSSGKSARVKEPSHTLDDSGVQKNQEFNTDNNDEQPEKKVVPKMTVTRLKIIKKYDYGYLDEIEVRREDQHLHTFKEGDFPRLRLQDIKDMRVEDLQLGVESYQKKLKLTKPDTFSSDLRKRTAYTAYSDPQGVIYIDQMNKNRIMRIDELYKFSDGTLDFVWIALHDIASGIRMEYLPKKN